MLLRGGFGLAEIHLGRHLRLHIVAPHHGLQDVHDAARVLLLQLLHIQQLLRIHGAARGGVGRLRQQLARVVQHTHGRGRQLGHARRHQMHDARQLRPVQNAAGVQAHQHRGRRLLLLAKKTILVGQRQVHAGPLHRRQCLDRAGELTLQPALKIQPLLELRHAELARLHQLKPRHRALGQPLGGQAQAHVVHAVGRNQNGATAICVLVRHIHLRQLGHDGAAVLVIEVGKQHPVVGLAAQHNGRNGHRHQQRSPHAQPHALRPVERRQPLQPARACGGSDGDFSNCRHFAFQYGRAGGRSLRWVDYSGASPGRSLDKPRI